MACNNVARSRAYLCNTNPNIHMQYITLTQERNRRLTAAVRQKMSQERLQRVTRKVISQVLEQPVERGFFVSVDHIIVMDRRRREGKLPEMSESRTEMWTEIFSVFDRYLAQNPESTRTDAAIHVASQGRASRFYISPAIAHKIIKTSSL